MGRFVNIVTLPFLTVFQNLRMAVSLAKYDLKNKHTNTLIGWLWLVVYPLLLLSLYYFLYTNIYKLSSGALQKNSSQHLIFIFAGLIPFLGFSESLSNGISCVRLNASLIKNTLFPIDIIPFKTILVSSFAMIISCGLLFLFLLLTSELKWTIVFLPIIFIFQTLFMTGLIWILSSIEVFFSDVSKLANLMTMVLMVSSPIAYSVEVIPQEFKMFLYINPLYYIIEAYRFSVLNTAVNWNELLSFAVVSLMLYIAGYWFFRRLKPEMADYV